MKLSLVYYTYRPGAFDLLIDSLSRQDYDDWELIIVDDYPYRDVDLYFSKLTSMGIPLVWYGRQKEKCYSDTPFSICNVMNTGLLNAAGDVVVFLQDYSWLPRTALSRWNEVFNSIDGNSAVSGVGLEYHYNGRFANIGIDFSMFDPRFDNGDFGRFTPYHKWEPEYFELFYSAFPMSMLKRINGFDERSDYTCDGCYNIFVEQAKLWGFKLGVDHKNIVSIINHRAWKFTHPSLWEVKLRADDINKLFTPEKISPNCFRL